VAGWVIRAAAPATRVGNDTHGRILCTLGTPCELLLHDVYIHRDVPWGRGLVPKVYGQLPTGPGWNDDGPPPELPILPALERHEDPMRVIVPEVLEYHDILSHVMGRLSRNIRDFVLTRIRLPFPPMPALVALEAPLPEAAK
jgi:hypothetical protein